jgi:hypothetical protein
MTRVKCESDKGFYIGDVCYVLGDDIYYNVWGNIHEFRDGWVRDPKTGLHFAVAGTAWGDGGYEGDDGFHYSVDAGVIGLVPMELCEKQTDGGRFVEGGGIAQFFANKGEFEISLPNGEVVNIDTNWY